MSNPNRAGNNAISLMVIALVLAIIAVVGGIVVKIIKAFSN